MYLVYNTISNLLTQDEQVACFENAAAHLEPGGCFVIEFGVPRCSACSRASATCPSTCRPSTSASTTSTSSTQRLVSHHYYVHDGRVAVFESPHRYVWPAELDLMARIAGLTLRDRFGDWDRSPFTATSDSTSPSGRSPTIRLASTALRA